MGNNFELEDSRDHIVGIFKKIGFVYPSKDSFNSELGIYIKDQRLIISGRIEVAIHKDNLVLCFFKRNRYKKIYGLDESSEIEVSEESTLFGYTYQVYVPKKNITLIK